MNILLHFNDYTVERFVKDKSGNLVLLEPAEDNKTAQAKDNNSKAYQHCDAHSYSLFS